MSAAIAAPPTAITQKRQFMADHSTALPKGV
jgi:hypothetical protein